MNAVPPIREGQILSGPQFSEPLRVKTVGASEPNAWSAGLVGTRSERFRKTRLTADDVAALTTVT